MTLTALLGAGAAGCGQEARLLLQLRSLPSEDPYSALVSVSATVRKGGATKTKRTVPFTGEAFELPAVELEDGLEIDVAGVDASGAVLARGLARPKIDSGENACCVVICFCTVETFDAGACTCGVPACERTCAP